MYLLWQNLISKKKQSTAFKIKEQHITVTHLGHIACKESFGCYFSSQSEELLNKHRIEIHPTYKQMDCHNVLFPCDLCEFVAKHQWVLNDHKKGCMN